MFSSGADVTVDFDPLSGLIQSAGSLQADVRITDSDLGAVIRIDGLDGGLLLLGVAADDLSDANLLF